MRTGSRPKSTQPNPLFPSVEDEIALLDDVLARDSAAWRRFVAKFDPILRNLFHHGLEPHQVDDLMGDFWLAAVSNDMRMLRAFKPARGASLGTWLTFQIGQLAADHRERADADAKLEPLEEARNVPAPGIINLRQEVLAALSTPQGRRAIAAIVRETIQADEADDDVEGLMDAEAAAELLSMTPAAVRKAAARGSLPCHRLGRKLRFKRSELLAQAR